HDPDQAARQRASDRAHQAISQWSTASRRAGAATSARTRRRGRLARGGLGTAAGRVRRWPGCSLDPLERDPLALKWYAHRADASDLRRRQLRALRAALPGAAV